jgi:hypothetical protein
MVSKFMQIQDGLLDRLQASGIPQVWEGTIPAGVTLKRINGIHLPYAIVTFGGISPVRDSYKGIASSKYDIKSSSIAVLCVGDSLHDARMVADIVRESLEGYQPDPDWGELTEQLSGSYTVRVPDANTWPLRNAIELVFNTNVNATAELV